jgi:hypothetical protein
LIDQGQVPWALEVSKQLMYADGEQSIDYSALGWAMSQVRLPEGVEYHYIEGSALIWVTFMAHIACKYAACAAAQVGQAEVATVCL